MSTKKVNQPKLYNTPLEIGFRALVMMRELNGHKLEIEKLMYLDFLSLNTSDIGGPPSLAAPIPNRGVQVFARKELLQKGITILLSKELVNFNSDATGFNYSINEAGKKFLTLFNTKYFFELTTRSVWIAERFGGMSLHDIRNFINSNMQRWGGEFL